MPRKSYVRDLGGTPRIRDFVESSDIGDLAGKDTVATADIDDDAVTNAKLANMATKTYKGRTSGSTGDPEDVAAATVRGDIEAERLGVTRGFRNETNTSYTAVLTDLGVTVFMNSASAMTFTLPPISSVAWTGNGYINIIQGNTGQVTIAPGAGVSLSAYNGALKLAGQYAMATLITNGADFWVAGGNLTT